MITTFPKLKRILGVLVAFSQLPILCSQTVTYDDAIGEIKKKIVVNSDQMVQFDWTSREDQTVRFVGDIRNLTEGSKATVVFLVDGIKIWEQDLTTSAADPHMRSQGFDVIGYDLKKQSQFELQVRAFSKSAQVIIDLRILPEPFLSKWKANLPTGYPNWSDKEKLINRQKGKVVLESIRQASQENKGELVIPAGDYLFNADWNKQSTLENISNLKIKAKGVTFWFEPPLVHALLFKDCNHVSIEGLTIDFTVPCFFQAQVLEINRERNFVRAKIMEGYGPISPQGKEELRGSRAFICYDSQGQFINHRHLSGQWKMLEDRLTIECQLEIKPNQASSFPKEFIEGCYIVGSLRTGTALRMLNCSGMKFEGVNLWSSPGMALQENVEKVRNRGENSYHCVRATRRPLTNRLHAFGADIFHFEGSDIGPRLDRCESAYGSDDGINIHGSFGRVIQKIEENAFCMDGAFEPGDQLEFWGSKEVNALGTAKVVSVKELESPTKLKISENIFASGKFLILLDKPLDLPPLTLVVMDRKRSAAQFVIQNSWFHDNFQRILINGSPQGTIVNNTFKNMGHGICIQFETWGPWMEGPFASDMRIENNRFLQPNPLTHFITVSMHPPKSGGSPKNRFSDAPFKNLLIKDNFFDEGSVCPISVHNVDGLEVFGNMIHFPSTNPFPVGLDQSSQWNWIYLQDCKNVRIQNNLVFP